MPKSHLSNNCYNLVNQLSKKLKAIWAYDKIIKDAKACKNKECERVFKKIREDDIKHAKMLQETIIKLAKENKFK
jgi:hypothetical protein